MKRNTYAITAGLVAALYLFVYYWEKIAAFLAALFRAASPLLVGAIVAYLVNILMVRYEKHYFPKKKKGFLAKSRRPVCLIGAFLTLLAVIALVVALIIPQLSSCIQLLFEALPGAIQRIVDWAKKWRLFSPEVLAVLENFDWQSRIGAIAKALTSGVGDVMGVVVKVVTSVISGAVTGFLSLIFSIYLLGSKDTIGRQAKNAARHYLPAGAYEKTIYVCRVLNEAFHRYIVGQCTEAVILGVLCTVCMIIFGLPFPTMIGALIAFTSLIPIAGAYIGAALGALLILAVSPIEALMFLVLIVVLQQFEGNLIYPRVVGASTGLPSIWVLAAITVGGGIFGVLGMLLGVPIAAAAYRILREDIHGIA